VDSTSTLLLNEIALHHFKQKPLTVSQAMDMSFIAGPATIHRKIKELQKAGLVELSYSGLNRRTKYLIPTDAANSHFKKMSEAMKTALNT
jgi:predicted transcriptional regulator